MSWSRRGSGLLAACALLLAGGLVAPTTASAASVSAISAGITYEADDGDAAAGATVTDFDGSTNEVTIPDTIEIAGTDYDVVAIDSKVFQKEELDNVDLGDNLAEIGEYAFWDNKLPSLTLPDSVTTIGKSAFGYNELASLILGNSVTTIGEAAFGDNELTSLTLPASVDDIGPGAFSANSSLVSVVFTGSVPSVLSSATDAEPSFDTSSGSLVLTYPWAEGDTQTPGGYESSTWKGYVTQAVATVDFDLNGYGTTVPDDQGVEVGETADLPAVEPTESGYDFTGWYTDAGATTEFDFNDPITGDITLYAGWEEVADQDGPTVTKTVDASFVRVFDWDLAKSGQVGEVTVDGDTASADVDYTVTATPQDDRNAYYSLSGEITVENTFVEPVTLTVTDEPDVGVDATCDVYDSDGNLAEDVRLGAEESATFDYSCSLEGIPEDGTNTAVVTNENGDGQSRVEEAVVFEERDTSFDTVNIDDDKTTPENGFVELGEAEWNADGIPAVFDYTLTQSDLPVGECTSFTNTAMIAQTEQSAEGTVEICPEPVTDPEPTPTPTPDPEPTPGPDQTPTPSVDPVVPAKAETIGLPKTGMDAGGLVGAALLLIGAGGAAVMIRRKVRN